MQHFCGLRFLAVAVVLVDRTLERGLIERARVFFTQRCCGVLVCGRYGCLQFLFERP